mgnify:CR=1 FL=1
MLEYHVWFNLKPGAREPEALAAVSAFLTQVGAAGESTGFRLAKNNGQPPRSKLGAYHGAEMAYAYGTLDVLNRFGRTRAWTDEDRRYSEAMMGYWVNFARTGNPNGPGDYSSSTPSSRTRSPSAATSRARASRRSKRACGSRRAARRRRRSGAGAAR